MREPATGEQRSVFQVGGRAQKLKGPEVGVCWACVRDGKERESGPETVRAFSRKRFWILFRVTQEVTLVL